MGSPTAKPGSSDSSSYKEIERGTRMTVAEIMQQAQALSPPERKELVKLLVDSLEIADVPSDERPPVEHWGKALNRVMDEIGPIEMLYPEIEDSVEWVKHLREEERRHRLGDWGEADHA